jgi:hypothetical protein
MESLAENAGLFLFSSLSHDPQFVDFFPQSNFVYYLKPTLSQEISVAHILFFISHNYSKMFLALLSYYKQKNYLPWQN